MMTEATIATRMFTDDPDLALVELVRQGDDFAFEELVRRYDRKLFRISQNVLRNFEDAQEAVQTVFFKAYRNLDRFQGNSKFSTWLIRITLNESLMILRKRRGVKEESIDSESFSYGSEDFSERSVPRDLTDWAPNPESLYSSVEIRSILNKSLGTLPPNLRIAFMLRDVEGYSIMEMADFLNLTVTAVKSRVFRARMLLREDLSRYFKKTERHTKSSFARPVRHKHEPRASSRPA